MSNVSYAQALAILKGWDGSIEDKKQQWQSTYNFMIWPPPPLPFFSGMELAQYIADNYTGPVITG